MVPTLVYTVFAVHFFLFKFHLFSRYGVRLNRTTSLVAILNTSYLLAFFSLPLAHNMFGLFTELDLTVFQEVNLQGHRSPDLPADIRSADH